MIFFGSRGRQIKLGEGQFNCPHCQTERPYKHMRSTVYFTLYFIPLFPIRKLGEYILCESCNQALDMRVLDYEPPSEKELLVAQTKAELEAGMPIHMMEKKLLNTGLSAKTTTDILEHASRGLLKTCTDCSFSYISTVTACTNCGGTLKLS